LGNSPSRPDPSLPPGLQPFFFGLTYLPDDFINSLIKKKNNAANLFIGFHTRAGGTASLHQNRALFKKDSSKAPQA